MSEEYRDDPQSDQPHENLPAPIPAEKLPVVAPRKKKSESGEVEATKPKQGSVPPLKASDVNLETVKQFFLEYWQSARSVCLSPNRFYDEMPRSGGFFPPTVFLATSAIVGAFIPIIWTGSLLGCLGEAVFCTLIVLLIARGVTTAMNKFGGTGDFEATYRVMSYASPPMVFMSIPMLGTPAVVWMAVLWFIGLRKIHEFYKK